MEPKHPYRIYSYEKFKELLIWQNKELKTKIKQNEIIRKAINLEKGIFNYSVRLYTSDIRKKSEIWNEEFENIYKDRLRHVYFNLLPEGRGSIKNPELIKRYLIRKEFDEEYLCEKMSAEEMYPELWSRYKASDIEAYKTIDPNSVPDGIYKCGKCKSYKTTYTEVFQRSIDEPSTKRIFCVKCHNRWKVTI